MADDDTIWERGEGGACELHAIYRESSRGNRLLQVKVSCKLFCLSIALHLDMKISHGKETHAVRTGDEVLVDEGCRLFLPAIEYQLPYLGEGCKRLGTVVLVWTTAPESFLIELDGLILDATIDHAAQVGVANRQSFQPMLGRSIVPKAITIVASRLFRHQ